MTWQIKSWLDSDNQTATNFHNPLIIMLTVDPDQLHQPSLYELRLAEPARSEKSEGCPPKLCASRAKEGSQLTDQRHRQQSEGGLPMDTNPINFRHFSQPILAEITPSEFTTVPFNILHEQRVPDQEHSMPAPTLCRTDQ
ncbi:MAG TPA: hypothetical protein VJ960_03620 [Oceanipulchritudo sp.]|nr:hypothetical protein [Oceanipulchritudo sp.]